MEYYTIAVCRKRKENRESGLNTLRKEKNPHPDDDPAEYHLGVLRGSWQLRENSSHYTLHECIVYVRESDSAYLCGSDTAYIRGSDIAYIRGLDIAYIWESDIAYIRGSDIAYIRGSDTAYIRESDPGYTQEAMQV